MHEKKFKLYLFYNDNETSCTLYIRHARWHRCLRSDASSCGRKPECPRPEGPEETHMSDLVTTCKRVKLYHSHIYIYSIQREVIKIIEYLKSQI